MPMSLDAGQMSLERLRIISIVIMAIAVIVGLAMAFMDVFEDYAQIVMVIGISIGLAIQVYMLHVRRR